MTRRPMPIQPAPDHEVAANWVHIKERLASPRPFWRHAWVLTAIALVFVSLSAGAAVVITRVLRKPAATVVEAPKVQEPVHRVAAPAEPMFVELPATPTPMPPEVVRETPRAPEPRRQRALAPPAIDKQPEPEAPVAPPAPPQDIFVLGSQARAVGDFGKALHYYEQFVTDHPTDARAALASIEACRILADHLEEPARALVWAQRTVKLAPRGPIREDALAREVQLLGVTGATVRCTEAKDSFLRDYPESIHTDRVKRACASK